MTSILSLLPALGSISLPLAVIGNLGTAPLLDLVPLAGISIALVAIVFGSLEKMQKRRLRHELMRVALEKGQAIPAELLDEQRVRPSRDDRRSGLIAIAFGLALTSALYFLSGNNSRLYVLGLIPLLVGAALLLNWWLERQGKPDQHQL